MLPACFCSENFINVIKGKCKTQSVGTFWGLGSNTKNKILTPKHYITLQYLQDYKQVDISPMYKNKHFSA